jgi:hypothetical protein
LKKNLLINVIGYIICYTFNIKMKVKIKITCIGNEGVGVEKSRVLAKVFSFDVKFTGAKRTAFYRKLFGYSSRAERMGKDGSTKIHTYSTPGLLNEIPHAKLGKSVIAVPKAAAARLRSFFSNPRWQPMELHTFDAILPPDVRLKAMEATLDRKVKIAPRQWTKFADEINELATLIEHQPMGPEVVERINRTLRVADELVRLDWSDGLEFSRMLEAKLAPLRKIKQTSGVADF